MPETWTGRLIGKMHNNNITQGDVAKELGVSRGYVSMVLNGVRKPKDARKRMEDAVDHLISVNK